MTKGAYETTHMRPHYLIKQFTHIFYIMNRSIFYLEQNIIACLTQYTEPSPVFPLLVLLVKQQHICYNNYQDISIICVIIFEKSV